MGRKKYTPPERVTIRLPLQINQMPDGIDGITCDEKGQYTYTGTMPESISHLIDMAEGVLILPDSLYLAGIFVECWCCHKTTPVIVPFSPGAYFGFMNDGEPEFHYLENAVRIHTPKTLPVFLQDYINQNLPFFKLGRSKTTGTTGWMNHCNQCGKLQGEFFLHSEPGEGFFLMDPEDAEGMPMVRFQLPHALIYPGCPDHSEWIKDIEAYGDTLTPEAFAQEMNSLD